MKLEDLINKYKKLSQETNIFNERTEKAEFYDEIIEDLLKLENSRDKILLVEDGSIDINNEISELEEMGYKIIVYRQGSNKPELLNREYNKRKINILGF